MNTQYGFSFVELFISFVLIIVISLGLLSQQLLLKQTLNSLLSDLQEILEQDNRIESQYVTLS